MNHELTSCEHDLICKVLGSRYLIILVKLNKEIYSKYVLKCISLPLNLHKISNYCYSNFKTT